MDTDEALESPFAVSRLLERGLRWRVRPVSPRREQRGKRGWIINEQVPSPRSFFYLCLGALLPEFSRDCNAASRPGRPFISPDRWDSRARSGGARCRPLAGASFGGFASSSSSWCGNSPGFHPSRPRIENSRLPPSLILLPHRRGWRKTR